jgi:tRNA (cytidine/uridine-2'-O-)-methyltransferase
MNAPTTDPQTEPPRLHVILVEPEIAGNTGAIGRTCVAAGATLWLVRPLGFHLDDRNLRRAGLDYWQHLDLHVVDSLDEVTLRLGGDRLWFFSTKAAQVYTQARFRPGDAMVFGPESRGLPERLVFENPERALRIPIFQQARSLNLESATLPAATELVFLAAITRTWCVTVGSRVLFAGRCRSRVRPGRGADWRRARGDPPVHEREHLVVSPDHRVDDGTPKFVEFLVIHLEVLPHFAERLIPTVFRQQREVIAEGAYRECLVQIFLRAIGLIEQRLRVGHQRFCHGTHVQIPP